MNILTRLYEVLESFNYPVFVQGTMGEDEQYPANFFTYWIYDSLGNTYYDNTSHSTDWSVNVIFYTNDITLFNTVIPSLIEELEKNDFLIDGKGFMTASDEVSHVGWIIEALYPEQN